ncbi:Transcription factor Aft1, HRA domain protein [Cordyceps fumosorosea ARSEF 2679]|uniref:Transcription factor Aft1, HRA domain protein n=1 Tax=Cordyceps fumosorosea (strain ARSEF 2679) TaxID=1081104 RepID=A0A162ID22_CORFA|nr:Transcription factor Aft1, HRA domain protein [Cordyceps fumosorosea ARSEF 2679]OAA55435.1 Transcription factor Aft1, HRA domain protein [Cordyceps fumosorosea ARSEF 2679]
MGTSGPDSSTRVDAKSPVRSKKPSPPRQDSKSDTTSKTDSGSNVAPAKPLAPPPRPSQQETNTPDYFAPQPGGSLSLEPNPFEQSFGGGGGPETPGGTKLPSVAALTSPSALLPGTGTTPFNWGGGSLRTGPLSPAMLSGPATDYFTEGHLRGGFPTPNESSLRSGLTPGGSGSMFPAPSPNSQALFAQLASGGATPNTLDFHRTALSAAAKRDRQRSQSQNQQTLPQPQAPAQQPIATQPQDVPHGAMAKAETKPSSGPFDGHDNDAANGLYMLAQGGSGPQGTNPPANLAQPAAGNVPKANGNAAKHTRGASEASNRSEENEDTKPARGKGKKAQTTGRRKADEPPAKAPPAKKAKGAAPPPSEPSDMSEDEDDGDSAGRSKMTDEEKRKNFLERNRVAALKCRQRKKQWLANLQSKVEMFSTENEALTSQITALREEVVNLKTLLLAHKDCPVGQQQGLQAAFMQPVMEPFPAPQMNPYGMGGPMPNQQQVMAGQGVPRRYS